MQNRFKSWALWTAVAAQVIAILQLTGVFEKIGLDAGMIGDVVAGILQILVFFGILNNPTDSQKF
jgi:uncharacterized membrane protein